MNTILQVEDDPNDVFFLQKAMKKAGVTNPIQVASDGQEAIDYLQGAGKFAGKVLFGSTNEDFASSGLSLADLNRDGRPDVLFTNSDGFGPTPQPCPRPWHGVQ